MGENDDWPEWVCSYRYDGSSYGITIPARNEREASARLRAIGMTAQIDGQLMATIPDFPGVGLWLRIVCAVRNLFAGPRP